MTGEVVEGFIVWSHSIKSRISVCQSSKMTEVFLVCCSSNVKSFFFVWLKISWSSCSLEKLEFQKLLNFQSWNFHASQKFFFIYLEIFKSKLLGSVCFFYAFERNLLNLPRLHLFDQTVLKTDILFYLNIFSNLIYFCDSKLNFQHHYSSDPSEIILICWFAAQETISFFNI